jgi:hypothetical protein
MIYSLRILIDRGLKYIRQWCEGGTKGCSLYMYAIFEAISEEESHKLCACHLLNCDEGQGQQWTSHRKWCKTEKKKKLTVKITSTNSQINCTKTLLQWNENTFFIRHAFYTPNDFQMHQQSLDHLYCKRETALTKLKNYKSVMILVVRLTSSPKRFIYYISINVIS